MGLARLLAVFRNLGKDLLLLAVCRRKLLSTNALCLQMNVAQVWAVASQRGCHSAATAGQMGRRHTGL